MKMRASTKRKMRKQRQRRIAQLFNRYDEGSCVNWLSDENWNAPEGERLILMHKNQLDGNYYFVCRKQAGTEMQLMKLVYDGRVKMVKVSDKNFAKNEAVFSDWVYEAEIYSRRYHY